MKKQKKKKMKAQIKLLIEILIAIGTLLSGIAEFIRAVT